MHLPAFPASRFAYQPLTFIPPHSSSYHVCGCAPMFKRSLLVSFMSILYGSEPYWPARLFPPVLLLDGILVILGPPLRSPPPPPLPSRHPCSTSCALPNRAAKLYGLCSPYLSQVKRGFTLSTPSRFHTLPALKKEKHKGKQKLRQGVPGSCGEGKAFLQGCEGNLAGKGK